MTLDIIGVAGKSGSGKDFLARELRLAGYVQWSLAWHMKHEATGHGFSYDDVMTHKPPAVREYLQRRGTEDGWQKHGRFYWCEIAAAWMRTMAEVNGVTKFVIPDVRFKHEFTWIGDFNGKLVRMEHGDRPYPLAGTPAAEHASETDLDDVPRRHWDCIIVNNIDTTGGQMLGWLADAGVLKTPILDGTVWRGGVPCSTDPWQMGLSL